MLKSSLWDHTISPLVQPNINHKVKKSSQIYYQILHLQGSYIQNWPKFPDISLTFSWHKFKFPWQYQSRKFYEFSKKNISVTKHSSFIRPKCKILWHFCNISFFPEKSQNSLTIPWPWKKISFSDISLTCMNPDLNKLCEILPFFFLSSLISMVEWKHFSRFITKFSTLTRSVRSYHFSSCLALYKGKLTFLHVLLLLLHSGFLYLYILHQNLLAGDMSCVSFSYLVTAVCVFQHHSTPQILHLQLWEGRHPG